MVRRYELTEEAYALTEDLLPKNGKRGGQWNDHHVTLNVGPNHRGRKDNDACTRVCMRAGAWA